MRDSQKSAVYKWERRVFGRLFWHPTLSLPKIGTIVAKVMEDYGIGWEEVEVRYAASPYAAYANYDHVAFGRDMRSYPIVLHECAHIILSKLKGLQVQPHRRVHGRLFASQLLDMWVRYLHIDGKRARRIGRELKPRRVRFRPMHSIIQPERRVHVFKEFLTFPETFPAPKRLYK